MSMENKPKKEVEKLIKKNTLKAFENWWMDRVNKRQLPVRVKEYKPVLIDLAIKETLKHIRTKLHAEIDLIKEEIDEKTEELVNREHSDADGFELCGELRTLGRFACKLRKLCADIVGCEECKGALK